jgi:hypothetical protein
MSGPTDIGESDHDHGEPCVINIYNGSDCSATWAWEIDSSGDAGWCRDRRYDTKEEARRAVCLAAYGGGSNEPRARARRRACGPIIASGALRLLVAAQQEAEQGELDVDAATSWKASPYWLTNTSPPPTHQPEVTSRVDVQVANSPKKRRGPHDGSRSKGGTHLD